MATTTVCKSGSQWLKAQKGPGALAALTGQDARALAAFMHLLELFASSDANGQAHALAAMGHAVQAMQPSTRWLAHEGIAHVLDWSDRDAVWVRMNVPGPEPL